MLEVFLEMNSLDLVWMYGTLNNSPKFHHNWVNSLLTHRMQTYNKDFICIYIDLESITKTYQINQIFINKLTFYLYLFLT